MASALIDYYNRSQSEFLSNKAAFKASIKDLSQARIKIYKNIKTREIKKDLLKKLQDKEALRDFNINNILKEFYDEDDYSGTFINNKTDHENISDLLSKMKEHFNKDSNIGDFLATVDTVRQLSELFSGESKEILSRAGYPEGSILSIGQGKWKEIESLVNKGKDKSAKAKAKANFSNLIGNLGETYGLIQVDRLVKKMLKSINTNENFKYEIKNTGGESSLDTNKKAKETYKTKVADTTVSIYDGDNNLVISFGVSHKMSVNYIDKLFKLEKIDFRNSSFSQVLEQIKSLDHKKMILNAFSYHYYPKEGKTVQKDKKGNELRTVSRKLYWDNARETKSIRDLMAAYLIKKYLYGLTGEKVYFLNYGQNIVSMNQLLKEFQKAVNDTIPYVNSISQKHMHDNLLSKLPSDVLGTRNQQPAIDLIKNFPATVIFSAHIGTLLSNF